MRGITFILLLPFVIMLPILPSLTEITVQSIVGLYIAGLVLAIITVIMHTLGMKVMEKILERMPPVFASPLTGFRLSIALMAGLGVGLTFLIPDTAWWERLMILGIMDIGVMVGLGIERLRIIKGDDDG